jgi:trans-aconitate methyltransferase
MATPVAAGQCWDPELYAKNARFVSDLGAPALELLSPKAGERILDLGCGDGALSRRLVDVGCTVVGVDASAAQVDAARRAGIDARVSSGEALAFDREFDAVFSNAALHWMKSARAVIDGVYRALVPGGRFVAEFGGQGCVKAIRTALSEALGRRGIDGATLDPWYFPSVEEYSALLSEGGFHIEAIASFPRPTPLPTGIRGWLETFAASYLSPLPPASRPAFLDEVAQLLSPTLTSPDGSIVADYVRLRFAARRNGRGTE